MQTKMKGSRDMSALKVIALILAAVFTLTCMFAVTAFAGLDGETEADEDTSIIFESPVKTLLTPIRNSILRLFYLIEFYFAIIPPFLGF